MSSEQWLRVLAIAAAPVFYVFAFKPFARWLGRFVPERWRELLTREIGKGSRPRPDA